MAEPDWCHYVFDTRTSLSNSRFPALPLVLLFANPLRFSIMSGYTKPWSSENGLPILLTRKVQVILQGIHCDNRNAFQQFAISARRNARTLREKIALSLTMIGRKKGFWRKSQSLIEQMELTWSLLLLLLSRERADRAVPLPGKLRYKSFSHYSFSSHDPSWLTYTGGKLFFLMQAALESREKKKLHEFFFLSCSSSRKFCPVRNEHFSRMNEGEFFPSKEKEKKNWGWFNVLAAGTDGDIENMVMRGATKIEMMPMRDRENQIGKCILNFFLLILSFTSYNWIGPQA